MEAEEKTPELTKEMIDELNKDFEKSDPMVVAEKLTSLTGVAVNTFYSYLNMEARIFCN